MINSTSCNGCVFSIGDIMAESKSRKMGLKLVEVVSKQKQKKQ